MLSYSYLLRNCIKSSVIQEWGGRIAAADDDLVKEQLQTQMEAYGLTSIWYGAKENDDPTPMWKWVSDCSGCTQGAPGTKTICLIPFMFLGIKRLDFATCERRYRLN